MIVPTDSTGVLQSHKPVGGHGNAVNDRFVLIEVLNKRVKVEKSSRQTGGGAGSRISQFLGI